MSVGDIARAVDDTLGRRQEMQAAIERACRWELATLASRTRVLDRMLRLVRVA